jgi:hypothetical protein
MNNDERLRRLEASVVSSDRVLQLQAESLMVAAAHRAERTAAWGVLALSAAAALVGKRSVGERRPGWAPSLIRASGTLLHMQPALLAVWRALSALASHGERRHRRR